MTEDQMKKQKKRRSIGCLAIVVLFLFVGIYFSNKINVDKFNSKVDKINESTKAIGSKDDVQKEDKTTTQEKYREFDDKTWADFVEIYGAYQGFLANLSNYTNGNQGNAYSNIKKYQDYFKNKYNQLDYAETDEMKTYLQPLQMICLSSQTACEKSLKYIDTMEEKHFSSANDSIEEVKQNVSLFAENRGKLLVKAGYTDEEIKTKVENEINALQ